jgi:F0F1-type ATP synthase delta subunit
MSDETENSMNNSLAINSNAGLRAANHDQNTIFQQNNSQANELLQSLVETRRQTVALFEQRMTQENQMFQNTMQMVLANQDAANARTAALQTQQQSYSHQEAQQSNANTVAMHYADVGAITIIP